ncbi:hypothetical protein [Labedaea rhizosphaerae]|uniref:hypothetical protein n=1 Tax=Labedaea rhizosphaerae TaxID=598644 RepID=UPI00106011F4|nr:hypothetical protein [Labedaea rhizosphaerae]
MIAALLGVLMWLPVIVFGLFFVVPFLLDAVPPAMPRPPSRSPIQLAEIAHRRTARRRHHTPVRRPPSVGARELEGRSK